MNGSNNEKEDEDESFQNPHPIKPISHLFGEYIDKSFRKEGYIHNPLIISDDGCEGDEDEEEEDEDEEEGDQNSHSERLNQLEEEKEDIDQEEDEVHADKDQCSICKVS